MDPIYKELKRLNLPSYSNTTLIATDKPSEIVDKLSQRIIDKNEAYSLMIVIGNVGSGKTTFVRYFKTVYMEQNHSELAAKCEWIFVDMNTAPVNKDQIYTWLIDRVIQSIISSHGEIDFDNLDVIQKIYQSQIKKFEKGIGKLLTDESEYNRELYGVIQEASKDKNNELIGIVEMLRRDQGRIPIIVFDNCDKRDREAQLLMFEVAQWFRDTYKCVAILPMRDDTYDMFKNEKPLDTVVKDLVFRIDAPNLLVVLQERLRYIYRICGTDETKTSYMLDNGIRVHISKHEQSEYAKSILAAIRNNGWAREIFYKLSDRNTRYGIQLFEDLCKSGHIKARDIFGMRVIGEEYLLPNHILMNALLRKNRRFYNDEQSNFVNLFHSNPIDDFPDPFVRLDILRYLEFKKKDMGPNNIIGYVQIVELAKAVQDLGMIKMLY